jgi:hypothetical protein
MSFENLRNASTLLRFSSQLPDDVADGEDREVPLKPLPPPE